jgi:hypothetical protein
MHQAAAKYWNQIAETQPLATPWAQQMFPLPQTEMDLALQMEESRLVKQCGDRVVVAAYLALMPLLWERTAISNYLLENPELQAAMPPLESLSEALRVAAMDYPMTGSRLKKLQLLLEKKPT